MKLSIIVSVYNITAELGQCVSSLLRQDGRDGDENNAAPLSGQETGEIEIILVDDGSTDPSCRALCDRYAGEHPGLIRAIHRPNGGPGAARNTGVEAASGEYLTFVDGDDYVSERYIGTLLKFVKEGFDAVIFDYLIDDQGKISPMKNELLPYGQTAALSDFPGMLLSSLCVWNKLWRRSLFTEHGIRFPEGLWYEDLATVPKLCAAAKTMTAVHEPLYYYVVREGSITRDSKTGRDWEIMTVMDSLLGWFRENGLEQAFHNELEAVAVKHVYLTASVRVLRAAYDTALPDELSGYLARRFPAWKENAYVKHFPARHRWILRQLSQRRYRLVRTAFLAKDSKYGCKTAFRIMRGRKTTIRKQGGAAGQETGKRA